MSSSMSIFDRRLVRDHKDRAATYFDQYNFLYDEVAMRLVDRLNDTKKTFNTALDLGCCNGVILPHLTERRDIIELFHSNMSEPMARTVRKIDNEAIVFVSDEEFLPVSENSLDLIISNLNLHWVNDLPGALIQIRKALRPDGLFLASLFGGRTLKELRLALQLAETEICGGMSPRVSPFIDVRDAGNLLTRAGFALPVTDVDTIEVTYDDMFKLMADIRGTGDNNSILQRHKKNTHRNLFSLAAKIYETEFSNNDSRIKATFDIVFLTAWAPHLSQQKSLRPGSASVRLADALGSYEVKLKDNI